MTNEEKNTKLMAVLTALNKVSVSGKDNMGNLAGSIAVIEEVVAALQKENAATEK